MRVRACVSDVAEQRDNTYSHKQALLRSVGSGKRDGGLSQAARV